MGGWRDGGGITTRRQMPSRASCIEILEIYRLVARIAGCVFTREGVFPEAYVMSGILFLKHHSSIFRQSSKHVCGFSMMEKVRLCAVWHTENWLSSSMNHIQGWITVWECYCHALEKGCLYVMCAPQSPYFVTPPSFAFARERYLRMSRTRSVNNAR